MKKYRVLPLILLLFSMLFFGCDSTENSTSPAVDKSDIKVVFIPKLTGNAFFEAANNGVQKYAAEHNFSVEYRGNSQATVANQIAIVKEAIAEKVNAISISSLDATALDGILKEAMAAGIKVVTWDSDVSGDARQIMVSQGTPDQLGSMLVEMGAKSLVKRGINPSRDVVKYAWHYSRATVTDQNSWQVAGEKYIKATYPKWINVAPQNYYSEQLPDKAIVVGEAILKEHPEIDLIICNDSTSLPGQAQAAKNLGFTAQQVTITGFASPNPMKQYCAENIIDRWGLWDCQVQGALSCYVAHYLALGKQLKVGDRLDVPEIGTVEVMPNTVLDPNAYASGHSGVILLPNRTEFTKENMNNYDF